MNIVTFPEFNLSFNISKIAFSINNFDIYWYAICIVSGIILALILCLKDKTNNEISFEDILEIITISLIIGIIGARLYYVIFQFDYYKNNLIKIFNIRDGGLAIYGGIIFGALAAILICIKKKINILKLFDYVCPYLVLAQGIGRWGNFFNKEAYGLKTDSFFRMGIYSGLEYIEVHPCFLYEFLACIFIFILLKIIKKYQKFEGELFSFYLILYGIFRFLIEGLRADSLMLGSFKISQIISIIFVLCGILLIHRLFCRKKSNYKI